MLQKQAEKNYLCSLTDKRKTMKHTNPQVEQMTSFIVMDVLERANELQKQGVDIIVRKRPDLREFHKISNLDYTFHTRMRELCFLVRSQCLENL